MNPPSALYGAMNKERKPFTYTPGGLDLSEIKSERMAQRLMRNAMSEGVPESPISPVQTYPTPLNTGAIPNFNCLPVQVFPTFPLPANPKSLLRTRSNPDPQKETVTSFASKPSLLLSDDKSSTDPWKNINTPSSLVLNNNNSNFKQTLPDNCKTQTKNAPLSQYINYGSNGHTEVVLPEKSYDAEYFVMEPQGNVKLLENETSRLKNDISSYTRPVLNAYTSVDTDIERNPMVITPSSPQDRTTNEFQQKEVTIVKKQTNTQNEADHNGDTEAAVVVKLPSKKSSAKTETKVEVSKKTLPDGSIKEIKTTTTKTTIDGKTEIKTETETTITPKESDEDIVEIEEQEEESEDVVVAENESDSNERDVANDIPAESEEEADEELNKTEVKENGHIIDGEEKVEVRTTKNVVVTQSTEQESEEELEEEIEEPEEEVEENENEEVEEEQVIVLKKQIEIDNEKPDNMETDETVEQVDEVNEMETEDVEEEEEEVVEEENPEDEQEKVKVGIEKDAEEEVEEEEKQDEVSDEVNKSVEQPEEKESENKITEANEIQEEEVEEKCEKVSDKQIDLSNEAIVDTIADKSTESIKENAEKLNEPINNDKEIISEETTTQPSLQTDETIKQSRDKYEDIQKITVQSEPKVTFKEPSIPFEKVEDIEIKPIGPAQEIIKKSHTEIITTTKDEPTGALSTQTEYNRIENIVTVNRTTKTLDPSLEQSESTIPTLKTYFAPHNDRILSTPQPISRPYQPVYTPEPQQERRHSLLLDRLSIERQIPIQSSDIYQNNYQYNNQSYEQNQWLQEPQSEVLTVSNVKPSTITKNQQWYQQNKREENVTSNIVTPTPSNIVTPTPMMPSQQLSQSQSQPKPQYQSYIQPQYTPNPEFQPTYKDTTNQSSFKSGTTNIQQNIYPNYTPKPSWVSSTFESKPTTTAQINQYSTLKNESNESYQKSSQQYSSSYVPPPWEQDSSYIAENQNFYQPPPSTTVYTPNVNQTWKPNPPASKFSKPAPTSYIPPAPNQSFVKPVTNVDQNILPGRKTYYSEYERRYISVPESTYIPIESKFQAQPDPSPQYYFDNNEPSETVEPQWRKELREFTEKTSQSTVTQTEKLSVRPPWEDDPKYTVPSTVTPTWTQTLRPRTWRERSYEPEYIGSKEWPKTNTLGRGRPQSSYLKSNVDTIQERTRGVSVDRYNPNSYQSPLSTEQPPVQSHTLTPNIHPKAYHNPNVPSYHARTSAEPREQTVPYIQRSWGESRAPPVQSRSFKYLQWITGTED